MVQSQNPSPDLFDTPPPPPPPPRQWYTYEDVAEVMRVSKSAVYKWVKEGRVPSPTYMGKTARFNAEVFSEIIVGVSPPGTFTVGDSPRRKIGRKGGNPNVMKKKKKPTAKKAAAKKKPAKKKPAKKGVVK